MRRLLLIAAALAACLALVAVTNGSARTENPRPTSGGINYWKTHVVGFARRASPWWRGYLSQGTYRYRGCLLDTRGVVSYGCRLENSIDGTVLAFVGLARFSGCSYGYTLSAPASDSHALSRLYRFCG